MENGCFFHAYIGSLDKTLIESTMCRVPVITINPEYLEIFGTWSNLDEITLVDEYTAMRKLTQVELKAELNRRVELAVQNHSLEHWINLLMEILK